jgi:hypothetical protein
VSDEDDDADPLPWESSKPLRPNDPILPDGSSNCKLSPLLPPNWRGGGHSGGGHSNRHEDKPVIIKQSLKNFSGLEGVSSLTLSTQDSMETTSVTSKVGTATSSTNIMSAGAASSANSSNITSISATSCTTEPNSSLSVAAVTKRSIQAEKSAPLSSTTSYSKINSHNMSALPQMASSTSSSTLFAKVGKSTKKHSLDEDFIAATTGKTHWSVFKVLGVCEIWIPKCNIEMYKNLILYSFRNATFNKLLSPFNIWR